MALFQGANDSCWFWISAAVTVLMGTSIWFMVLIGRERDPNKSKIREVERFSDIEEDHAPVPQFLMITFIGTALWGLGYLIWTGMVGVTGF
jgi:hypothetical protein